jgi:DNA-binding response OmpR family regulator
MSESHLPLIRTLIVDDEMDICHLLTTILRRKNMEASFVNSLSEARSALKEGHPDILFLDNYLPDGLGIDFIHYVRSNIPKPRWL